MQRDFLRDRLEREGIDGWVPPAPQLAVPLKTVILWLTLAAQGEDVPRFITAYSG